MSTNYNQLLIDIEKARQLVQQFKQQRFDLLDACDNKIIHTRQEPSWFGGNMYNFTEFDGGAPCLELCYADVAALIDDCPTETHNFYDVLVNNNDGKYCEKCIASYKLRVHELKDARKHYGNMKRKLIYAGKRLIKQEVNDG